MRENAQPGGVRPTRRRLALAAAGGTLAMLSGRALPSSASTKAFASTTTTVTAKAHRLGRVLVVGAGFGGATAAKYLKHWGGPAIDVVLIDPNPTFVSCPLSNLVLSGSRRIEDLTVSFGGLHERGVQVIRDTVTAIDASGRRAKLALLGDQPYDRIVVAPGVEFQFDQVQGLDQDARRTILHAWKAGPQTVALRRQLQAMPDGGVYVLTIPRAPYRCPPGPYERICQIAHYFKTSKPRSKIVVLDANEQIASKKALFEKVFADQYASLIDYQPNANVTEVDARTRTAITELGDRVRADVLNVLPPQAAGAIARRAGLINANERWCDVDWLTMESTAQKNVHVLGDATLAAALMPKSGHMANQHGKTAAAAIVEMLSGRSPSAPMMANTCYSYTDPRRAIHIASVHRYDAVKRTMEPVPGAGGLSSEPSALEGAYASAWATAIWSDMLT